MIFRDVYTFQREARGKHRRRVFISQKCPMIDNLTTFIGKVITAHPSLAFKVYKCKVLERFRNIEKAPSRNHFQDGAFLLWIRANTLRRSRLQKSRCSSNTCLSMGYEKDGFAFLIDGFELSNLTNLDNISFS